MKSVWSWNYFKSCLEKNNFNFICHFVTFAFGSDCGNIKPQNFQLGKRDVP